MKQTHYTVLQVPPGSNQTIIRNAYINLALKMHPDAHSGATKDELKILTAKFTQVTAAYECLKDRNRRAEYDKALNLQLKKCKPCAGTGEVGNVVRGVVEKQLCPKCQGTGQED